MEKIKIFHLDELIKTCEEIEATVNAFIQSTEVVKVLNIVVSTCSCGQVPDYGGYVLSRHDIVVLVHYETS